MWHNKWGCVLCRQLSLHRLPSLPPLHLRFGIQLTDNRRDSFTLEQYPHPCQIPPMTLTHTYHLPPPTPWSGLLKHSPSHRHTHTHTHTPLLFLFLLKAMHCMTIECNLPQVCVCVCVWDRVRERERESEEAGPSAEPFMCDHHYSWAFIQYSINWDKDEERRGLSVGWVITGQSWEAVQCVVVTLSQAVWGRGGGEPREVKRTHGASGIKTEKNTDSVAAMGGSLSQNRKGSVSSPRKKNSM